MITFRDVSVVLPPNASDPRKILESVELEIGKGEWVALVGPNGSGKTTMLHTMAGLIAPSNGVVDRPVRSRVSLLLQEPDNQFVTTSVRYELELARPEEAGAEEAGAEEAGAEGAGAEEVTERVETAVDRFGLAALLDRNPHRLSGGEKQRLALATVWLQDPEVLLLDEPTAYLDGATAELCAEFVDDAHRRGVTVVWATPGGEELVGAGRIVCLDGGRIVYDGSLEGLYEWADGTGSAGFDFVSPAARRAAEVLAGVAASPEDARGMLRASRDGVDALAETLAPMITGVMRPAETTEETPPAAGGGEVVAFAGVEFGYDGDPAVTGLGLLVRGGECVGLAGPNGAGKSTVLGLAAGAHRATAGTIRRRFERAAERGRSNVFYLFQSPERLFFAETVSAELDFGLTRLALAPGERARRAGSALEFVGLAPELFLDRAPLTLSLGEMRRVAFAIALSLEPEFLLLDEPTSCLDPIGRSVLESILAARRAGGQTTMVASHDASFLAGVCDRVIWLRDGRLDAELTTANGRLAPGAKWPGEPLTVLRIQRALAERGVDVTPRALTPQVLAAGLDFRPRQQ